MADQQHDFLRAIEHHAETGDVAAHDLGTVLSSRRRLEWAPSDDPVEVDGERAALELAVARVVQLGDDDERDVPPGEGQLSRLANTLELRHRAEVDLLIREDPAQSTSLLAPGFGQRTRDAGVTVDELLRAVLRFSVTREEQLLHRRTLR
jgi:hypothetical protein